MLNLESALKNKRILVLDDLVEARSAMKKMVTLLGATQIDSATSGKEASDAIMANDYDLVLADYNLGKGKDGQQVLEEARYTNRLKASSLFVMVTGENAVDMVMGALEYEPDNYITKPFTLAILRERLIRILSIKKEIEAIDQAIDAGQIDQAIALAHQLLEEKPRLLMPLTRILGRLYMRQKRYAEAQAVYTQLLDQKSVAWARLGRAICMHYLGDSRSALALIEQCLLAHPMYVQCYDWSATILQELGDTKRAQIQLQKAVGISPKAVLRQMELGRVAFDNDDTKTAINAFEQAIRLGRHSCYKNAANYLKFAQIVRTELLDGTAGANNRELRQLADKSFKMFEELREEYAEQTDVLFDTCIIEGKTYIALNDEKHAKQAADNAETLLRQLKQPSAERQLQMAEAFIDTHQHAKAKTMLNIVKSSAAADSQLLKKIVSIESNLNTLSARERTTSLNSQGIEFYTQRQYAKAVVLFDEAAQDDEASISVLINAVQAKISLMESTKADAKQLKECGAYFNRIGLIPATDERYERFERLRNTYIKLKGSVSA